MRTALFWIIVALLTVPTVSAQTCPTLVQDAYIQTAAWCQNLGPDDACVGQVAPGMLTASARADVENFSFAVPGDIVRSQDIEGLSLRVDDVWTTLLMKVNDATLLILGEVEWQNRAAETSDAAPGLPAVIQSPGGIIIRAEPRVDTDTVAQLSADGAIRALGRSLDQQWIQIQSAAGLTGWVFSQFVSVDEDAADLPIVDPAARPAAAAQGDSMPAFVFSSSAFADCVETPTSGILIQAADTGWRINGTDIDINGTAYLHTAESGTMTLVSLEGQMSIGSQTIAAGQQASLSLVDNTAAVSDTSPEDRGRLAFLPLRLLPRPFEIAQLPPAAAVSAIAIPTAVPLPTPSPEANTVAVDDARDSLDAECTISAGDIARNIRVDAGTEFQIASVLQIGSSVSAVSQKRGSDGLYWYATSRGWIRSDAGAASPACRSLPLYADNNRQAAAPAAPVLPIATSASVPRLKNDEIGDLCAAGGMLLSGSVQAGRTYYEFGGVWVGQPGTSLAFSAETPYFQADLGNLIALTREDGSLWLGSQASPVLNVSLDAVTRFRVRVAGLLGDHVTLRISCQ